VEQGTKEVHGKALNEREQGGHCSGWIQNRMKSRTSGDAWKAIGIFSESDCDMGCIRTK
jgi:hypothetical protein